MYAIIDNKGKQYKVQAGEELLLDLLDVPEGELVQFDRVLMIGGEDGKEPRVGRPRLEGARVLGEVIRHEKGPKLTMLHYYRGPRSTKQGHRQRYRRVVIREIHPQ